MNRFLKFKKWTEVLMFNVNYISALKKQNNQFNIRKIREFWHHIAFMLTLFGFQSLKIIL